MNEFRCKKIQVKTRFLVALRTSNRNVSGSHITTLNN